MKNVLRVMMVLGLLGVSASVRAEDESVPAIPKIEDVPAAKAQASLPKSRKEHEFETKVIEGVKMPTRPLAGIDGDANKNKGPLFKKRLNFEKELKTTSKESDQNP